MMKGQKGYVLVARSSLLSPLGKTLQSMKITSYVGRSCIASAVFWRN